MENATSEGTKTLSGRVVAGVLGTGMRVCDSAAEGTVRSWRFAQFNTNAWLRGSVFPAADTVMQMNRTSRTALLDSIRGDKSWQSFFGESLERIQAGRRYAKVVNTLGKELFGSATFAGETTIAEDDFFRLVYIPPTGDELPVAIFHVGGAIPYGDRIFRLSPGYNFYDRFLERGLPVYAMELKGDRYQNNASGLTMERLIESTQALSDTAFAHNQNRKMVLEGYCGHGTQALAYLAAMPADAERKFDAFATFVAPIDGTACTRLADQIKSTPKLLLQTQVLLWRLFGGYVPGDSLRIGLDAALEASFYKTALGYFSMGWMTRSPGKVDSIEQLNPKQQRELAGTYWVSPDCARRFPVPIDISRFTTSLFSEGIAYDGSIPFSYKDKPLSLQNVVDETSLRLYGFFGGLDEVVPGKSAECLIRLFGDRYKHVVHPWAGHISYVLSPATWHAGHPKALDPNPIDLLLSGSGSAR